MANEVSSLPSATQSATTTPTRWWLKCPENPALNREVQVSSWDPTGIERTTRFEPSGRVRSVVLYGPSLGDEGTLVLRTYTSAEYAGIKALLGSNLTLLLQNVIGQQWYLSKSGDTPRRFQRSTPTESLFKLLHFYEWSIPLVEVRVP